MNIRRVSQTGLVLLALAALAGFLRHYQRTVTRSPELAQQQPANTPKAVQSVTPHSAVTGALGNLSFAQKWEQPVLPAMYAFAAWATNYVKAAPVAREKMEAEGASLATARRLEMLALIKGDPEAAIDATIPVRIRNQLPEAVVSQLETRVAGTGTYDVLVVEPRPGQPDSPLLRMVELGGTAYHAYTYGRRLPQATKYDASLSGIALDREMAVFHLPIRLLEPGEIPAGAVLSNPLTGTTPDKADALIESHGQVWAAMTSDIAGIISSTTDAESGTNPYVKPTLTNSPTLQPRAASTSWTTGEKKLLIIRVDFPDQPGTTQTAAEIQAVMDNEVNPFYLRNSYGKTSITTTVAPKLYRLPRKLSDYVVTNDTSGLHSDARTLAGADFAVASYDRVMVAFTPASGWFPGWAGLGNLGGKNTWLQNSVDLRVASHELGHNMGLSHANLWQVTDGNSASPNGTSIEYGDSFDAMGRYGGANHDFGAYAKNYLGWIPDSAVTSISGSGHYRVYAHDNANALSSSTLALKFTRSGSPSNLRDCWISLRAQDDLPGTNGAATVNWCPGAGTGGFTQLLDCTTPGTDINDAGVSVGGRFSDAAASQSIVVTGRGGSGDQTYLDLDIATTISPAAPAFTTQPVTPQFTLYLGSQFTLSAFATAAPDPAYKWFKDGVALTGDNPVYTVSSATINDAGTYTCVATNSEGSATSKAVTVTIVNLAAPVITSNTPTAVLVPYGKNATISVAVTGNSLIYQWFQVNQAGTTISLPIGGAYSGTNTATLSFAITGALSGSSYYCFIRNAAGGVSSNKTVVTLVGNAPPWFTSQPTAVAALQGVAASLSCTATGATSYQWLKSGAPINGATGQKYTIPSVQASDVAFYACVASNEVGSATSDTVTLAIAGAPPILSQQLVVPVATLGGSVTLSCSALSATPLSYLWCSEKTNSSETGSSSSNTKTLANVTASDAAVYYCIISNSYGSVETAHLPLSIASTAPVIVKQPVLSSPTVPAGTAASLTIYVSASPAASYQWFKGGLPITGAISSTLSLPSVQQSDAGAYTCRASNSLGTVLSAGANLSVGVPTAVAITASPPSSVKVMVGETVSLSIKTAGGEPTNVQWFSSVGVAPTVTLTNGPSVSGATTTTITLKGDMSLDGALVTAKVWGSWGTVYSMPSFLHVSAATPPVITIAPVDTTVLLGQNAAFGAFATGANLTYQWQRKAPLTSMWSDCPNNSVYSGATTTVLTVTQPAAALSQEAYRVVVKGVGGTTTSGIGVLTVSEPQSSQIANLSVRASLSVGQTLTVGFVTSGAKKLLTRAVGPTLASFGFTDFHPTPSLTLRNSAGIIATNSGWTADLSSIFSSLGAFALNAGSHDAAVVQSINGASIAEVAGPASGVVLVELYDADAMGSGKLMNVSARNQVGAGTNTLVAGFVITGNAKKNLLIRGSGPALAALGVPNTLPDPTITIYRSDGTVIATNDNWDAVLAANFALVGAFGFPAGSKDAAIVVSLPAGSYSVQLSGVGGGTGDGLIELYALP